ncbi:MAG: UPF0158 family protein [Solirubrobacteraceae bacterium]
MRLKMLDLGRVDLDELCMALEDNSYEHVWWIDPVSGELEFRPDYYSDTDVDDADDRALVMVEPIGSGEGYADMEDFAARVSDPRARDLLLRAISGRGAFRRFKDTLLEFPELREEWFRFHGRLMERRAIEWLELAGLITADAAACALAERPEPELPALDQASAPDAIARN